MNVLRVARFAPKLHRFYSSSVDQVPKGFWWLVNGKLAALAKPKSRGDLEYLESSGVTHLVSLTDKVPEFHGVDINSVHIPIEGGGMPTVEQAKKFVDVVEEVNANGGGVALHCGEGQGRTSVMLACFTVKADSCTAEEAIEKVRSKKPGAVGTEEREMRVKEFENLLKQTS